MNADSRTGQRASAAAALAAMLCASPAAATDGDDPPAVMPDGESLYASQCLGCHQADGRGVPRMQPPIVGGPWVSGDPVALAAYVITGGFDSAGRTGRAAANVMPAFRHLDDASLAALLTYTRAVFGDGDAGAVTVEHVHAARASDAQRGNGEDAGDQENDSRR